MMIRIDPRQLRDAVLRVIPLDRMAEEVGVVALTQVRRRFEEGGDEEISWPALWADNREAQDAATGSTRGGRAERDRRRKLDDRYEERIEKDRRAGKIGSAELRKRRARLRKRRELDGRTEHYRAGGEPLRDTGALMASMTQRSRRIGERSTRTEIGSPLEYAGYQQSGFSTSGLHYIPRTMRARGGWNESLIAGVDYVLLRGVTVPPRPFLRFTDSNRADIRNTIVQAGRVR